MKKFFFWFMVAATMMMAGCEKLNNVLENEDDNGGGANRRSGKKVDKVTWVYDEGGSQTYVTEQRFNWDGDKLTKIDIYDGGVYEESVNFTYGDKGLSEIRSTAYRYVLSYMGSRVSSIDYYYDGNYRWNATLTYNTLGQISKVNVDNGDFVFNLTWNNGNVMEREVVSEGRNTYAYDNKSNPFNTAYAFCMALMDEDFTMFSDNNLMEEHWTSNSGYTSDRYYTYTYDASGTWPVTKSYTSSGGSGTYYILYADGTGSAGPGGGGQTSYTVSVVANNSSYGYVTGGGTYAAGSTATITAYPYSGYQFSHWNDGNTSNPRTVSVTGNVDYVAYFVQSGGGGGSTTSVTFGSTPWSDVYFSTSGILYYPAYDVLAGYLFENSVADYPYIYMQIGDPSVGTTSMPVGDDGYISGNYNALEYYENTSLMSVSNGDTTYYGDWWGKSATVTFASLDFNAHTANLTVNATMFDAYGAFINDEGIDGASTRNLVISLPSLNFTQASKAVHAVQGMRQRQIAPGTLRVAR